MSARHTAKEHMESLAAMGVPPAALLPIEGHVEKAVSQVRPEHAILKNLLPEMKFPVLDMEQAAQVPAPVVASVAPGASIGRG